MLLAVGALLLVVLAAGVTRRRAWRAALTLPPPELPPRPADGLPERPDSPGFTLPHIAAPLIWFLFAGSLLHGVGRAAGVAASSPASGPNRLDAYGTFVEAAVCASTLIITFLTVRSVVGSPARYWGLSTDRLGRDMLWAIVGYAACWPVVFGALQATIFVLRLLDPHFVPAPHLTLTFLHDATAPRWAIVLALAAAAALAPLMEETYFRGLLQPALSQHARSTWLAIALTATLFGLMHVSVMQTVPPLIVFGAALGYVTARTRSLTAAVLMHVIFNVKTLLFFEWYRA